MSLAVRLAGVGLGRGNPVLAINLRFTEGVVDPRITFTRASTATYTNSAGLIASAAIDAPRIDYDPVTLACKGLLIEEARTNLLLRSQEFDNASWVKLRSSVTANAIVAPDGTTTADKLVEDSTATNTHVAIQLITKAASAIAYDFSVFMKQGERTKAEVRCSDQSGNGIKTLVNLSAGTLTAISAFGTGFTATLASISPSANGFYRVDISFTTNSSTSLGAELYCADAAGAISYTGDGTSGLYIWGAQLEAGSFATSYIPTVASQVTRAADVAVMTGSNFSSWYNQSEGMFVVEFDAPVVHSDSATYNRVFDVNDGTTNNAIRLFINGGFSPDRVVAGVTVGAADQFDSGNTAGGYISTPVTGVKNALSYKLNDFATCWNGSTVVTDASGTLPTPIRLEIANNGGGSQLNGHIRRLTYYPSRLQNATLQALSA